MRQRYLYEDPPPSPPSPSQKKKKPIGRIAVKLRKNKEILQVMQKADAIIVLGIIIILKSKHLIPITP